MSADDDLTQEQVDRLFGDDDVIAVTLCKGESVVKRQTLKEAYSELFMTPNGEQKLIDDIAKEISRQIEEEVSGG